MERATAFLVSLGVAELAISMPAAGQRAEQQPGQGLGVVHPSLPAAVAALSAAVMAAKA